MSRENNSSVSGSSCAMEKFFFRYHGSSKGSGAPDPMLEPWYRLKNFSIAHEEPLTEELFSRDIAERLKKGYDFLLPYYRYFVTLDGDADPREQ